MSTVLVRYIPLLASILGLVAVSVLVGASFSPTETPVTTAETPVVLPAAPQGSLTLDPAATFATIVERPLFSPSRRPAQPSAQPAAPQAKAEQISIPTLSATLIGVFISPAVNSAMVRLANGKTTSVNEGETVDGWILKRVSPDLAQFHFGTSTVELTFPVYEAAGSGSAIPNVPGSSVRRRR